MISNQEALAISIDNLEPLFDPAYGRETLIISETRNAPSAIMKHNNSLLKLITAYQEAIENNEDKYAGNLIPRIELLLTSERMNCTEFASFWKTQDVSYSMYKKFSLREKYGFLRYVLPRFIDQRHDVYLTHGYSASTIQTIYDTLTHKATGQLGKNKISFTLCDFGFTEHEEFNATLNIPDMTFVFPDDNKHKKYFPKYAEQNNISLPYRKARRGKLPDIAISCSDKLLIGELKHLKEPGGGQSDRVEELINFIKQTEQRNDVHYISFLDGILFNIIFDSNNTTDTSREIKNSLNEHPNNYFVNTTGFKALIESLIADD